MEFLLIGLAAIAAGCLIWPAVARVSTVWAGALSSLAPGGIFLWLLAKAPAVARGDSISWTHMWVPQLGVALDFRLSGPGLLLALLITGIGALILIYGGGYFKGSPQAAPFFGFVQLFMLAMLGVAISDNLLLLFIFWELTSLASYLLIGLSHAQAAARQSALRALLITGAGGLALLAAILLLAGVAGTYNLHELQAAGDAIRDSALYPAILGLVLFAACTKSAQVPFHFWLPDAMAAPTPVSAYLHSATMVKAGVFLLAVLNPVLGGMAAWHDILTLSGAITMLWGSLCALAQTDLKRLLAYSTMSALGTLVMLLGMGTDLAITAAMVFLVVHALYKAPLFMIAGVVDKATGTRDIDQLHGLGRRMPVLAVAAAFAAFSMSGVPPFVGFIGKELLYEAEMHASRFSLLITCLGFTANAVNVAVALKVGISPFLRGHYPQEIKPAARSISLLIGPVVLALAGALFGLVPAFLGEGLINAAVRDVTNRPADVHLQLWHGFTLLLAMSVLTVALGVMIYAFRHTARKKAEAFFRAAPGPSSQIFDTTLAKTIQQAGRVTRFFQHGNLRIYIILMLGCLAALIGAALFASRWTISFDPGSLRAVPGGVALLMVVAAVLAIRSRSSIMAILAMGGVGYGVALLFGLLGAPDLALTQVLIETLTLVLLAFLVRLLPEIRDASTPRRRAMDAAIAIVAGTAITLALLAVSAAPPPQSERISEEMAARSLPEAHGRNIVNVILVDFRALDTMGEACVLVIAAIGVSALLLGTGRRDAIAAQAVATPLFHTSARWLTPLLIGISLVLLFRGHNEPGGGFVGGLVAGAGLVLSRLALAPRSIHVDRLAPALLVLGLVVIVCSALPFVFPRAVFMQGVWAGGLWLPLVGMTKFGTPFLFDAGIYFIVVGVVLMILTRVLRGETLRGAAKA